MKLFELFEDHTIPQLQTSIEQGFPNTKKRQHATGEVRVTNNTYTPFTNQKVLRVEAHTQSNSGEQYNQFIDLRNITYEYSSNSSNVPIEAVDNHEYYVQPIQLNTTNVGVFCTCPDYQMRFAAYNMQNNCHIGPPPARYVRKTENRPEVNPDHVPGMCKHLLKVTDQLRQDGIVI
jgi:hypothetical protein